MLLPASQIIASSPINHFCSNSKYLISPSSVGLTIPWLIFAFTLGHSAAFPIRIDVTVPAQSYWTRITVVCLVESPPFPNMEWSISGICQAISAECRDGYKSYLMQMSREPGESFCACVVRWEKLNFLGWTLHYLIMNSYIVLSKLRKNGYYGSFVLHWTIFLWS